MSNLIIKNKYYLTPVLVVLCLSTSLIIKKIGFWHVNNYAQEVFRFGWLSFALILMFGIFTVTYLNLRHKYPVSLSIVFSGLISNILERLYQGYVVDYINFGIGVANLADIFIYISTMYIVYNELFLSNRKFS